LVTNLSLPADDVKGFVKLAQERDDLMFASSGVGSSQHIAAEMFKQATGVNMTHVPYKGSAQAMNDLLSGQVQLNFDSPPPTLQFIRAGKLKVLAITSSSRSALLPDVPTMQEAGLPGFEFTQWFGVVGPAGMPSDIVMRLNSEINDILKTPAIVNRLVELGADPVGGTPAAFASTIQADTIRMAKIIKDAGISIE
jgi:tripartite-type tricarboxylate transporter receptor subunit TctC